MLNKLMLAAALAMTMLPVISSTAEARHIDVYTTRPSVIVPYRRRMVAVQPMYPVYVHHHHWRHYYPHYQVHVH